VKFVRRVAALLTGAGLAGLLLMAAYVAWTFYREPWPDHGAAMILFLNEEEEDVWVLSLRVDQDDVLSPRNAEVGPRRVNGRGRRGESNGLQTRLIRILAGSHEIGITYRIGGSGDVRVLSFPVQIEALSQCEVRVTFRAEGSASSRCEGALPASLGGLLLH